MKVLIIYREESDHARAVREFLREYERRAGRELETVNPDTADGAQLCRLYDVVEYPTVVATTNDGVLQQQWRGLPLPLINEVSYYNENN